MFYTLITGIVPADAPSRLAHMDNEGSDPVQPAHEMVATVPVHVAEATQRAMSLDAWEHFSAAEQL